jgi:hypothetical protein
MIDHRRMKCFGPAVTRAWPILLWTAAAAIPCCGLMAAQAVSGADNFPRPLDSYPTPAGDSLLEVLALRIRTERFNVVGTAIFFLAIVHTFLASTFTRLAHR